MKKILLVLITAIMTVTLATCGESKEEKYKREAVFEKSKEQRIVEAAEELHKIYFGDNFEFESIKKVEGEENEYIVSTRKSQYIVWRKKNEQTNKIYWAAESY